LWELSIPRPVLATVTTFALILFGWIGYAKLPVRQLPDVDFPVVSVVTVLPGGDPEVVEKEVTEVLEEEISTIEGIKTLTSESREQVSRVTIEFDLERDVDVAAQDVRDKIARARDELPDEAEEPMVSKIDLDAQAIMWISLNAPGENLRALTDYADDVVKEHLQRLPGVGSILIGGEKRSPCAFASMPAARQPVTSPSATWSRRCGARTSSCPRGASRATCGSS